MTRRPFTGRHMTLVLLLFFGIVAAVNVAMARLAVSGFGGTVVDNSYVASQHYAEWAEAARAQDALGWAVRARLDPARRVEVEVDGAPDAVLSARAEHRFMKSRDLALGMRRTGTGWRSVQSLDDERWQLRIVVTTDSHAARFLVPLER